MADVDVHVVLVGTGAATLKHFEHHRPGDDVAWARSTIVGAYRSMKRSPSPLSRRPPLAAYCFGDEDAQSRQPGRMELVKLHVLKGKPLPEHDAQAVAGQGVGVEVVLYIRPEPPVASTTALAWNTWMSPVASS